MSVQIGAAVKTNAPVIISAFGTTEDRMSVDIVPQVSGMLLKTFIQDGAVVTNGQPLFQIDPSDYAARVQQVDSAVAADRANLELGRMTLERNQGLVEKKLISPEDLDTLKTRVAAAAAQLKADEALLEQARLNLSRCTIVSTLAGVCSKRYLDDGNLVVAGVTRLTNIRSYDPIYVDFSVSEEYLSVIRQAMARGDVPIEITTRSDTNRYPGTLEFMDNAVNPLTGTILLRGQAPNSDLKLWSRQFVEVRVVAGAVQDAVMVAESAVQMGKQGTYLYAVSTNGQAQLRMVKTGVRYGNLIQIVDGVMAGENVVVLGQLMLYPGAKVVDLSRLPQQPGAPAAPGGK
jgi:membrane fusion protein, multidrug efflux system